MADEAKAADDKVKAANDAAKAADKPTQAPADKPAQPAAQPAAQPVLAPVHQPGSPANPTDAERMALLERAVILQSKGHSVGPTEGIDETVEGGKYRFVLPSGDIEWRNADGEELNEDGSLKYPGRQVKDVFGRLTTVRGR